MNKDKQIVGSNNDLDKRHIDVSFSLFETNSDFIKVYKKTEKIVSAIYLLTNHFDEKEPMKWTLRNQGNHILASMLKIRNIGSQEAEKARENLVNSMAEIVSLFEVAYLSGIVSEMNFNLLKKEFLNLITITTEYKNSSQKNHTTFNQSFFAIEETDSNPQVTSENTSEKSIGHNKGHNFLNKKASVFKENVEKKSSLYTNETTESNQQSEKNQKLYEVKSPVDMRKINRRNLILNTIKKKGSVMIKDLSPVIKGCSDKTIQRELSALIKSGLVVKEGKRRWSVYKIA